MAWQRITELEDKHLAFSCLIKGFEAVDLERGLRLTTTNGMTRNARRWFVHRYDFNTMTYPVDYFRVCFRAWDLTEAMARLTETRIARRVEKLAGTPFVARERHSL